MRTPHPGSVRSRERAQHDLLTSRDQVASADDGYFSALHVRVQLRIGPDAKAIDLLARLPAGLYQRALVFGANRRR